MLFAISSFLLLESLIRGTEAHPLEPAAPYSRDDLSLLNVSSVPNVQNATLNTNLSGAVFLPHVLPYSFAVPGTETFLRLGFGMRRRLDPMSIGGLIAVVQHDIMEAIARDGEEGTPGLDPFFLRQSVEWTIGDGIHLSIYSIPPAWPLFTWLQIKNVVEGLRLYLVEGERSYVTYFNFWDGPRSWYSTPLGTGELARGNEGVERADQKV